MRVAPLGARWRDNIGMDLKKVFAPLGAVAVVFLGWRAGGWGGIAFAVSGLFMWALLHFTRLTRVLSRAANQPVGSVGSAVMLNARLKPGVNLLHVVAMTQALGERLSPEDADPESYRWTDGSASSVTCEFVKGRLVKWTLYRPAEPAEDAPSQEPAGNVGATER